jgi:hypothetical protein
LHLKIHSGGRTSFLQDVSDLKQSSLVNKVAASSNKNLDVQRNQARKIKRKNRHFGGLNTPSIGIGIGIGGGIGGFLSSSSSSSCVASSRRRVRGGASEGFMQDE